MAIKTGESNGIVGSVVVAEVCTLPSAVLVDCAIDCAAIVISRVHGVYFLSYMHISRT